MKTFWTIIATTFLTLVFTAIVGFFIWTTLTPVHYLFSSTSVKRVEVDKRTLGSVVSDVVNQVEAKSGRHFRIIFSPPSLGENTRETSGGVFGNPPVEGEADGALFIVTCDYRCHYAYIEDGTILIYQ